MPQTDAVVQRMGVCLSSPEKRMKNDSADNCQRKVARLSRYMNNSRRNMRSETAISLLQQPKFPDAAKESLCSQAVTSAAFAAGLDGKVISEVFMRRPHDLSLEICLRALQCICEVGSLNVLKRLKHSLQGSQPGSTPLKQVNIQKISSIHDFLEGQETSSYLSTARSRYAKFYYYQSFECEVCSLAEMKAQSRAEKQKQLTHRETATYKRGLSSLPPTPTVDLIKAKYGCFLDPNEMAGKASNIVKAVIVKRHAAKDEDGEMRKKVDKYIKQGCRITQVLQGTSFLNPGLLLLFPGNEDTEPRLQLSKISPDYKALQKPISPKE